MSTRKKRKSARAKLSGPVKVGSPLYGLLEAIAARVAVRLEAKNKRVSKRLPQIEEPA